MADEDKEKEAGAVATEPAPTERQTPEVIFKEVDVMKVKDVRELVEKYNKDIQEMKADNRSLSEKLAVFEKQTNDLIEKHKEEIKELRAEKEGKYGDIITNANVKHFDGALHEMRIKGDGKARRDVYSKLMTMKPLRGSTGLFSDGLKAFQELSDNLVLEAALVDGVKMVGTRMFIKPGVLPTLTYFKQWDEMRGHFAKAMSTDSTAGHYGSDWVPTQFSNQVIGMIEQAPGFYQFFPRYTITAGNKTMQMPRWEADPTGYLMGESVQDESAKLPASQGTTGNMTFSPVRLGVRVLFSEESMDSTLPDIKAYFMSRIGVMFPKMYDEITINGDNSTTHMDSIVTSGYDRRKGWKGVRKWSIDGSDTTSIGDYATAVKILTCKNSMATYGINNVDDLVLLIGHDIHNYMFILQDDSTNKNRITLTYDAGGPLGFTVWNGLTQAQLFGMKLWCSEYVRNDLNASGVYDGVTTTKTHFTIVNTKGFAYADKKELIVKNAEVIDTFQTKIVAATRLDFEKQLANTAAVSWNGYNVTTGLA